MRLCLGVIALFAVALLAACATAPRQEAACANSIEDQNGAINTALKKIYRDPKGLHTLVAARTPDEHGDLAIDLRVWPMSGPQEPAPGQRMSILLKACTLQVLKSAVVSG